MRSAGSRLRAMAYAISRDEEAASASLVVGSFCITSTIVVHSMMSSFGYSGAHSLMMGTLACGASGVISYRVSSHKKRAT